MGPRIPRLNNKGLNYWRNKGKNGRDVMVYFHDDLDGIFSAVTVKQRMIELGYNIVGYGVLNYQESWDMTSLDPKMINVVVDFANMPEASRKHLIDIYIDHHGEFDESQKDDFKNQPVIKTKTDSAYEGICRVIGKPIDSLLLYAIDMVDSAKYDDYHVRWIDILNFDMELFKSISKKEGTLTIEPFKPTQDTIGWSTVAKLTFVGAFNQFIKRGDHATLIETVANLSDVSVYSIFNVMKRIFPHNNIESRGKSKGAMKDFVNDGKLRIDAMLKRTRGNGKYHNLHMSVEDFIENTQLNVSGYQIFGNIVYVPSGTWANALRARAILDEDYLNGTIPSNHRIDFILLQYGTTLQICTYDKMENSENLPILSDGTQLNDLGKYTTNVLAHFKEYYGYRDKNTIAGQNDLTISGGHTGIGSISNVMGRLNKTAISDRGDYIDESIEKYDDYSYISLMKNMIIRDLSGIEWEIGHKWLESSKPTDITSQLIRDIMNNDKQIRDIVSIMGEETKQEIKDKLRGLPLGYLYKQHRETMMDHKVILSENIRRLNEHGELIE